MSNDLITAPSQRNARALAKSAEPARELLAFELGKEEYGIDLLRVQEIRSYQQPTQIAGASAHVLGVIDLRGEIVPIVDLRSRFGMPNAQIDASTVIIVVNLNQRSIGAVVDRVNDVITLTKDQIREMPRIQSSAEHRHFEAMGVVDKRSLIVLNIESLLGSAETGLMLEAAEAA